MMKMNKRGAIEFSMTTIIIIIIGVAILALALPWVARTMGQAGELTDTAFSAAKEQLRTRVGPSDPLIVSPEDVMIKSGEQKLVTVAFYNGDSSAVNPTLGTISGANFKIVKSTDPGSIKPKEIAYWKLSITPKTNTGAEDVDLLSVKVSVGRDNYNKPLSITME